MKSFKCGQCSKTYSSRQSRWRHQRNDHTSITGKEHVTNNQDEKLNSKPVYSMCEDIPSFAKFSGEKPTKISALVDAIINEGTVKIQRNDFLQKNGNSPDAINSASENITDESVDKSVDSASNDHSDEDVPDQKSPTIKAPHLSNKEKKLVNKFSLMFRETKQNKGKLFVLLNDLRDIALIDNDDYDKVYNAIKNL